MMRRRSTSLKVLALTGFAFLYLPIVTMVVLSFNESRLVTVWSGFSPKWYGELLQDDQILGAAAISLKIAFISASLAVVLGTLAGFALSRFNKFRGKVALTGMVSAPLVMPEVITGLALLLLFVAMEGLLGWPKGRGVVTLIISHVTFCMAYVAVVVQSRLADMDGVIEEAALDLGARPWRVFVDITLPMIAPALVSGWLLSFTVSFDDLVISAFVSGPGYSTLPMVIFSKVRLGVSPEVNALATMMIVVVGIGVVLFTWNAARLHRMRQREERAAAAGL